MQEQPKFAISTYDGGFFDFENPEGYTYSIYSIAHALSNICRYGGHSTKFYSVAEHSVLVSKLVPDDLALTALFHDASEAFVGDMPTPLKAMFPEYKKLEERIQKSISDQFGLVYPYPPEIKLADKMMYKAEREQITTIDDNVWYADIPAANTDVQCLSPELARWQFLQRFDEIRQERLKAA